MNFEGGQVNSVLNFTTCEFIFEGEIKFVKYCETNCCLNS